MSFFSFAYQRRLPNPAWIPPSGLFLSSNVRVSRDFSLTKLPICRARNAKWLHINEWKRSLNEAKLVNYIILGLSHSFITRYCYRWIQQVYFLHAYVCKLITIRWTFSFFIAMVRWVGEVGLQSNAAERLGDDVLTKSSCQADVTSGQVRKDSS